MEYYLYSEVYLILLCIVVLLEERFNYNIIFTLVFYTFNLIIWEYELWYGILLLNKDYV